MFGDYFYNQTLRKMTIAFGQIFNNIQIKRKDSNGNVVQSIRVPLAYAPKEKFLTRLDQQPNLNDRQFAVTLPRLSFEITGLSYDGERKLIGIGILHKSNLVPIFDEEHAKDLSKMRR